MTSTDHDRIRDERNKIRARVMTDHRIGEDRSVRPVMILVRERTSRRRIKSDGMESRPLWLEQRVLTYNTGETRTYEMLEPIVSEEGGASWATAKCST